MKEYLEMLSKEAAEKWDRMPEITGDEIKAAFADSCRQIKSCLPEFTHKFQNAYSEGGFYKPIDNVDWTTGFWTGEIWLAYEYTGEEAFQEAAEIQIDDFYHRIQNKIAVDHHDMGFLYTPSCVAGYKLVGSETGKKAAILAADQLISRFQEVGGFIQAWGRMGAPEDYRLIIDCLLNVPLLYWATKETGDAHYAEIADRHVHTALANVIREDFSTWHTFFFDTRTGAPDHGATCQGYRDGSAWARGQAWGIYGTALAYRYTKRPEYIDIFRGVSRYYMEHLPEDLIPYWDLEFMSGDEQPRDSSSASIAACGMLEMANYLEGVEAEFYRKTAAKYMESLYKNYAVKDPKESNGLVLHSTYSNHSPYNTCNHYGVDECNSWGDYFYMEALMRLHKDWRYIGSMKKLAEMAYQQFPEDARVILATADRVCENRFLFTDKWDLEQAPFEIKFENEIDWEIDANGDPEYIWQFNRHRYFICLGQAYLMTGNEQYAEKQAELMKDWIQRIPLTPEHEMKAWRSLEAGFRGEYWTKAVSYIQDSPAWTQEMQEMYINSLYQHAEYIEKKHSDYKYISNWGVIENHGLFELALVLPDSEKKEHFIQEAFSVLSQAARIQFMEDGVHWEQSPTYHCEVVRCYLDVLLLAKKHGIAVPEAIACAVKKALDAMLAWKKPDGAMFMNGDSDDIDMVECFILGAYYFNDGRYKYAAEGRMDYEAVWNLGFDGIQAYEALPAEEPEYLSAAFMDSGHFYFRSGWGKDANLLHFTCGTLGAGHGHSDKLHVDLVMHGRDILVDSGRYTYAWANGRERYKNPQAHNTSIADGKLFTVCKDSWECSKLCQPANTAYKFTKDYEYAQGGHLGYIEDGIFVNRRVIHIKPDIYVIADEMYTGENHTYETFFHFNEAGETEVIKNDEAVYQDAAGKVQIFFRSETLEAGTGRIEQQKSKIARHYNNEVENDCLVITQQQEGLTSLYTVIAAEGSVKECTRLPVESVLKHKVYESKLAEALSIVTDETEYIIIICHQEVNSPTDLAGAKDCKGFGNVIIFDRNKDPFGGTVLHW